MSIEKKILENENQIKKTVCNQILKKLSPTNELIQNLETIIKENEKLEKEKIENEKIKNEKIENENLVFTKKNEIEKIQIKK
jgi:poly-gamma-glutamate capsule biosynthesis protein CapA/YwtB (metallophosphatase superfamily)